MTELFSTGDVAKVEGITHQAVYQAIRRGEIKPTTTTRGGRILFTDAEVKRYQDKRAARKAAK